MSGTTGGAPEEDKKPSDQSAHINLKVKGQVCSPCSSCFGLNLGSFLFTGLVVYGGTEGL